MLKENESQPRERREREVPESGTAPGGRGKPSTAGLQPAAAARRGPAGTRAGPTPQGTHGDAPGAAPARRAPMGRAREKRRRRHGSDAEAAPAARAEHGRTGARRDDDDGAGRHARRIHPALQAPRRAGSSRSRLSLGWLSFSFNIC